MSGPAVAALSRAGSDESLAVAALSRAGSDERSSCNSIIKGWFR